jgi:serine/threonine protein kinase
MNKNIVKAIIGQIQKNLPENVNPADYLSDILDIGKISAYRRLRGEIPFTLEEAARLSLKLGFSMDEIIRRDDAKRVFYNLKFTGYSSPEQDFQTMMNNYSHYMDKCVEDQDSNSILAIDYLSTMLMVGVKELFRFSYYTWLHHRYKENGRLYYSDVVVPDKLEQTRIEIREKSKFTRNNELILGPHVFESIAKESAYFKKLELITEEEYKSIQKGFYEMIDLLENIARLGKIEDSVENASYCLYLFDFSIGMDIGYLAIGDTIISYIIPRSQNPMIFYDKDICEFNRRRLNSLKEYSILITQSSEMIQTKYFNKQKEYVDNPEKNCFWIQY